MAAAMGSDPLVQLMEIELLGSNPDGFLQPFKWRVQMCALAPLPEPVTVSIVWVGSASSSNYDQTLDTFDIGPLNPGKTEFELECDPPELALIPPSEIPGVTILIISFLYRGQEFLRVGYYTHIAYFDEQMNNIPPPEPVVDMLGRFIAMPQPVVTVMPISWENGGADVAAGMMMPKQLS